MDHEPGPQQAALQAFFLNGAAKIDRHRLVGGLTKDWRAGNQIRSGNRSRLICSVAWTGNPTNQMTPAAMWNLPALPAACPVAMPIRLPSLRRTSIGMTAMGSRPCGNSKSQSATRMIFSRSESLPGANSEILGVRSQDLQVSALLWVDRRSAICVGGGPRFDACGGLGTGVVVSQRRKMSVLRRSPSCFV